MSFGRELASVVTASFLVLGLTGVAGASTGVIEATDVTAAVQEPTRTGFTAPFSGTPRFQHLAPKQVTEPGQLNRAIGQKRADRIARALGLRKRDVFTDKQYRLFVSGRGVGGDAGSAKLVDASVRILTNTRGRPLRYKKHGRVISTVLGSYGLMVNKQGLLQSPANTAAPTRKVNVVLEPGGYLGQWCRDNGAKKSLRRLYRSAYTLEAVYGNQAQQQSGVAQLVTNRKPTSRATVGMSMAPALWLVNFALIYTLSPEKAAKMPARWEPIPKRVARAISDSPTGQVPYREYAAAFE